MIEQNGTGCPIRRYTQKFWVSSRCDQRWHFRVLFGVRILFLSSLRFKIRWTLLSLLRRAHHSKDADGSVRAPMSLDMAVVDAFHEETEAAVDLSLAILGFIYSLSMCASQR